MHSGEIITKMYNLVAPEPHQQMAQLWIMSELVRGTSYLVVWGQLIPGKELVLSRPGLTYRRLA